MTDIKQFSSLKDALRSLFGAKTKVKTSDRIAGGDINEAFELTLTTGERVFMKSNDSPDASFFAAEAAGLTAISQTGTIGTPHILAYGTDGGKAFLLLEHISEKSKISGYWETFGEQLARMHTVDAKEYVTDGTYGFNGNNYIGHTEQINTPHNDWRSFFRECRLDVQFRMAERYFDTQEYWQINKLLERLDDLLIEPERPSLLHGDLWSGNFMTGNDGKAWLIDPAVYVGHAEADIAMTELFGGFPPAFYAAYREIAPIQAGYGDRRDLYNLYQLLNHLNMFGESYLSSVKRIIKKYV
ncbi:MAG: fructosamine kinase family protein [Oscillospiraceae bacterium]|nr:fructosamine kinase family protein [Oscillospiraceae bacterium]